MNSRVFYYYQVVTANLARIINSIGEYDMRIQAIELELKTQLAKDENFELEKDKQKELEIYKERMAELVIKEKVYTEAKEKIDYKLFFRKPLLDRIKLYFKTYLDRLNKL